MRRPLGMLISFLLSCLEFCFGSSKRVSTWRIRCLCDAERFLEAVNYASLCLSRWPQSPSLHYHAGRAGVGLANLDYARVRMAYAAALSPDRSRYRFGLAYCAQRQGQFEVALREYEQVLHLDPTDLNAWLNLGLVLKSQKQLDRALDAFERVLEERPKDLKALFGSALCFHRLGNTDAARERAESCLKVDGKHGKSHALLGSIAVGQGRNQEALEHFEIAHEMDSEDGGILSAMGRLHMKDNPGRGRHLLREALLVSRADRTAHFDLGQYYERTKNLTRASAEYALYIRHHDDKRARWAQGRLERIKEKQAGIPPNG